MKKFMVNAVIAVSLGAMTLSSCIGSFGLTNKVLDWNKGATDNKFINELIFLVISPAYAVCSVADLFVLNTIEFWTGDKVVANVGKTKNVTGKDGRLYAIKTLFSTRRTRAGHTARMAISVSSSVSTRMAASRLACLAARR